jgi:V8-like Glu-specific endopeptidase
MAPEEVTRRSTTMARKLRIAKPLEHAALQRKRALRADGSARSALLPLVDIPLRGVTGTRVVQSDGRFRVTAELGVNGLRRERRHASIPVTRLRARDLDRRMLAREIEGHRPSGLPTSFVPRLAKPTHQLRPRKGEDLDRGGTIFGSDDRYLFDDIGFPWRTTGKVRTVGKWGSGTTIGPRLVLTASHMVNWTGGDDGGVAWLTFTPGYFDGSGPWGEVAATRVIYWEKAPGSLTDEQTAFDYVVLVMEEAIGDIVGYPGFRTYNDDWNEGTYWQYIGYPGERSSGERPAFQAACVVSSVQDESLSGQDGYVLGHFNEFTPGQSGGAIWGWWEGEPWPRVVGVGSTIGSTAVQVPTGSTTGDNEYGGGPALSALISWARSHYP